MAYTISYNRPTSVAAAEYTLVPWGVSSEQYASTDVNPGSVTYTNLSSPFGRAETLQFRSRTVQDIYANTNVERALHLPTSKGIEIAISLNQLWTIRDAENPDLPEYAVPFKIRLTATVANIPEISETNVIDGIRTLIGTMAMDGEPKLALLMRGALDVVHNR